MANLNPQTREEVSNNNQEIFDTLKSKVGFVPNLYAAYTHSETALGDYLTFSSRASSLTNKEKEIVNLVVSEVNDCAYCKAAHTAIATMNGFSAEEILEIRGGRASFDTKFDALAHFVKDATLNRTKPSQVAIDNLLAAGYTKENLIDTILLIGEKTISNLIYGTGQFEVDFPLAPELEEAAALT